MMPSTARLMAAIPEPARLLGLRLQERLVELHDVGTGGEQIADLRVQRRRAVERQRFFGPL